MTPYIENLTNTLIGKHRLHNLFPHYGKATFIECTTTLLETNDVKDMKPETLGRILCSLETGDVMIGKQELFGKLHFSGDPGETLREMVAVCLSCVIHDRLDPDMAESNIPRYAKALKPNGKTPCE